MPFGWAQCGRQACWVLECCEESNLSLHTSIFTVDTSGSNVYSNSVPPSMRSGLYPTIRSCTIYVERCRNPSTHLEYPVIIWPMWYYPTLLWIKMYNADINTVVGLLSSTLRSALRSTPIKRPTTVFYYIFDVHFNQIRAAAQKRHDPQRHRQ